VGMLVGGWVVNRLMGWWRVGTFHFPSRSAEVLTALLAYLISSIYEYLST
jgi:hypothetical protein